MALRLQRAFITAVTGLEIVVLLANLLGLAAHLQLAILHHFPLYCIPECGHTVRHDSQPVKAPIMRNNVKERLSQTEDGRAIIELIESFGGWRRFTEASGLPDHYLQNWYKRGKISQEVALLLEQLPAFKEAGWDKYRMVPSVSIAEWNREKRTGAAEWFKAWQEAKGKK